ncbi:MAG TPA: heliorhodopsin HeR [Actinomycetota bacterium]|nr:heliorhodopsin HeR [Actinomycetota bacterium]
MSTRMRGSDQMSVSPSEELHGLLFPGASEAEVSSRIGRLRGVNLALGLLHAAQGVLILVLATGFSIPIVIHSLTGPPGSASETVTLFDLRVAWAVAAFLFISAIAHLLIASPLGFPRYRQMLMVGRNDFRWIEYSVSASLMAVLIGLLPGINDVAAVIAIFGANAAMILFGLLQEHYERPGGSLLPFWLGSVIGVVPWVAIGLYLAGIGTDATAPGFVYAIFVSLFVFFMSFAANMWLQYRRVGRWTDYLYGERVYMILSLVAKSALAWQIFAGTLAPTG